MIEKIHPAILEEINGFTPNVSERSKLRSIVRKAILIERERIKRQFAVIMTETVLKKFDELNEGQLTSEG